MCKIKYGERIKTIRKTLDLSQSQMAIDLNLSIQTISRYERERLIPSADTLTLLVEKYNVDAKWLLTGKGTPFSSVGSIITERIMKLLKSMNGSQQEDVMKTIEKEKLLADLIEERNKNYIG